MLFAVLAVACLIAAFAILLRRHAEYAHADRLLESLRPSEAQSQSIPSSGEITDSSASSETSSVEATPSEPSATLPEPEPVPEPVENPYKAAYLANVDMAAWIQIPDTPVDYPVMWTPRDEEYYLMRGFDGKSNQNGCLILDTDSCLNPLTTNLIIHGHNMKSGEMFGSLMKYQNEEYYQAHKEIILYTPECQRNYEVIAVFPSQVYKKKDKVFKFYQFFRADTEEEFDYFYNNIKKLSLYDTGVTAEFGDHFLTLSTCAYHVTNGRFVVIAKETEPGDSYYPIEK